VVQHRALSRLASARGCHCALQRPKCDQANRRSLACGAIFRPSSGSGCCKAFTPPTGPAKRQTKETARKAVSVRGISSLILLASGLIPRAVLSRCISVAAGVQAGYNYQTGCTLFGVEADWSWSDTNARSFNTDGDGPVGTPGVDTSSVSSRMRWFGTVRARSGVIVDNVLIYATGGFAYANFGRSYTIFEDAPATISTFTWNNTRWGWTAGVGTEWAFAPNWSLKSEVLYMRFEKDTATAIGLGAPGAGLAGVAYRLESQNEAWISRIGVNYRF
jgi:opacity protein-like surface antigen